MSGSLPPYNACLVLCRATIGKLMYYCDSAVDVIKVHCYKRVDLVHQMMVAFIERRDNEQMFCHNNRIILLFSCPSLFNMACLQNSHANGRLCLGKVWGLKLILMPA